MKGIQRSKKVIDDSIRFYLGKIQKEIVKQTELEFFFSHKSGLNPKQSGQNSKQSGQNLVKSVKNSKKIVLEGGASNLQLG